MNRPEEDTPRKRCNCLSRMYIRITVLIYSEAYSMQLWIHNKTIVQTTKAENKF